MKNKNFYKILLSIFGPSALIFLLIILWGIISVLNYNSTFVRILVPVLLTFAIIMIPVGIGLGVFFYRQGRIMVNSYDKRSGNGKGSDVPNEIKKWSWGAFGLGVIWGVPNGVWSSFLLFVPILNIVYMFVLGAKGNVWAWQNNRWESVEQFKVSMRRWNIAGIIVLVIILLSVISRI